MARPLRSVRLRLVALLRKRRQERDYDEELAFHQHMLRKKLLREGTPPAQADTATRRQFGNPARWHERLAEIRQFAALESITRDLSFAARTLRKTPGFTLTAILTIALGIGANTAIFSLVNGLLLRPLQVPHAEQLAVFGYTEDGRPSNGFSAPLFRSLEQHPGVFANVFAFTNYTQFQIGSQGGKTPANGVMVSGEYFAALETPALLGRCLLPADDQPHGGSQGPVVVISEHYWRHALNGDSHIIGRSLLINRVPFTIVGVMPRRFIGADPAARPEIFVPLATEPLLDAPYDHIADGYHAQWLSAMGRIKSGESLVSSQSWLPAATRTALQLAPGWWAADARHSGFHLTLEPGNRGFTYLRMFYRKPLQIVFSLCLGVLLLACLNLASLLFARAAVRGPELATRAALGASRRRLMQQLLVECLLLSTAGALLGLLAAPGTAHMLGVLLVGSFGPTTSLDTSLDWRVLAMTVSTTLVAVMFFGWTPALSATHHIQASGQKGSMRVTRTAFRSGFFPRLLLSVQVALALILVVLSGLVATSLLRVYRSGVGFNPHNLVTITLDMKEQPLEGDALVRLYAVLQRQLESQPGVKSAGVAMIIPFSGSNGTQTFNIRGQEGKQLNANDVSPGYFRTLGIPLLAGSDFSWSNTSHDVQELILSRSAAERLFPRQQAVGQEFTDEKKHCSIVGIVGESKSTDAREPAPPSVYFSIVQRDDKKPSYALVARVDGPAAPFAAAVRAIITRDAPEIPAPVFSTMSSTLDQSLSAERMMALLSVFFAACALLVTAIGLYGTLAYRTARRTSEIGIRIALGAQRTQVVSLIFRQNVAVTLFGAAAGLIAALLAARTVASFLYGTSTHDPLVLSLATLLLALVASIASLLPAIRAARIDPLTAIRTE